RQVRRRVTTTPAASSAIVDDSERGDAVLRLDPVGAARRRRRRDADHLGSDVAEWLTRSRCPLALSPPGKPQRSRRRTRAAVGSSGVGTPSTFLGQHVLEVATEVRPASRAPPPFLACRSIPNTLPIHSSG